MKSKIVALTCFVLMSTSSFANSQLVELTQTVQPPEFNFDVNLAGVKPGVKATDAKALVAKELPSMQFVTATKRAHGDTLKSAEYIQFHRSGGGNREDGSLEIEYTSPVVGNVVKKIIRSGEYSLSKSPTVEDFTAFLQNKFGKPFHADFGNNGNSYGMSWFYGNECEKAANGTDVHYDRDTCEVVVDAQMNLKNDGKNVVYYKITLTDERLMKLDKSATNQFMIDYENNKPKEPFIAPKL